MNRTPLVLAVSFPLLGRIRNFHPLATCAARRTQKKCHTSFSITLFYRKASIFFSYHILFCKSHFLISLILLQKVYKLLLKDLKKFLKLPYFCLSIRRLTEPISRKYHRYLSNLTRFIVPKRISDIDRKI